MTYISWPFRASLSERSLEFKISKMQGAFDGPPVEGLTGNRANRINRGIRR
jgi:hypothetical protein